MWILSIKKVFLCVFLVLLLSFCEIKTFAADYYTHTSDALINRAIILMENTYMSSSIKVLQGENSTGKTVEVKFANLSAISIDYMNANAVTLVNEDGKMIIYISKSFKTAPAEAIACLIRHETTHNDEKCSIEEEVSAWTKEAEAWVYFKAKNPGLACTEPGRLIERLEYLSKLYKMSENGSDLIRKEVLANGMYSRLALK